MAYVEAAVAYLQRALSISPLTLFPLRDPASLGGFATIEIGREAATLLILATVGWLAGRSALERLAWVAAAFETFDQLFLLPVPWVTPVRAPMVISLALITLWDARRATLTARGRAAHQTQARCSARRRNAL